MRPFRKRLLLVSLLVLSQVAALGVLAGALWLVKVKETMAANVGFSEQGRAIFANIILSSQDAAKLEPGCTIHGRVGTDTFTAQLVRISRSGATLRLRARVIDQDPDGVRSVAHELGTRRADAFMWTRTRRALAIFLDRSGLPNRATEVTPQ